MTVYRSKIGPEIALPVSIVMIGVAAVFVLNKQWGGLLMIAAVTVFVTLVMTGIRYRIDGAILRITCAPFYRVEIPIHSITRITRTRNPISSPAASLDRWEVRYGNGESVLISPYQREAFLHQLLSINPAIAADAQ